MKYLVLVSALVLTSCSSSNDKDLTQARRDLREANEQLETCQNQLNFYRNQASSSLNSSTSSEETSEPEAPAEPTCEEVSYDILFVDGKKLDTCLAEEVVAKECGVMATSCESGIGYACLKNVSYKNTTKKVCE